MSLPVVLRRKARAEFDAAIDWYEHQRAGLGAEFANHVQVVFDRISEMPEMLAPVHRDIRKVRVKRFPDSILYRVRANQVIVIAVFHKADGRLKPALRKATIGSSACETHGLVGQVLTCRPPNKRDPKEWMSRS